MGLYSGGLIFGGEGGGAFYRNFTVYRIKMGGYHARFCAIVSERANVP